jgi:hypothetical protein
VPELVLARELVEKAIEVGIATVSRYMPKTLPDPGRQQRWMIFLRNHKEVIACVDFFGAPTGSVSLAVRLARERSRKAADLPNGLLGRGLLLHDFFSLWSSKPSPGSRAQSV